jgi:hypothetical protein
VDPHLVGLTAEPLHELLSRLGIKRWDWLLVGDGSGCEPDQAAGWCCLLVAHTGERQLLHGALNAGIGAYAEFLPYLCGLEWLTTVVHPRSSQKGRRVHLVTDNAQCCTFGQCDITARGCPPLRYAFEGFRKFGLKLEWHRVPRETVGLHLYADRMSRADRIHYRDTEPQGPEVQRPKDTKRYATLDDFNPVGGRPKPV